MSNKITAVEWLVEELDKYNKEPWKYVGKDGNQSKAKQNIIEQAKEMEKEQIMDAHYAPKYGCFSEQYYKETYEL